MKINIREKAILVKNPLEIPENNENFSRIYIGQEFCFKLFPDIEKLTILVSKAQERNLKITLLTPLLTNYSRSKLIEILNELKHQIKDLEVSINDWGIIKDVKNMGLQPVGGRLLIRMFRDPGVLKIHSGSTQILKSIKETRMNRMTLSLLKDYGINRMEIDPVIQGLIMESDLCQELRLSLFTPYGFIATGVLCPSSNRGETPFKNIPCNRDCLRILPYKFKLKSLNLPMIRKGNTIFFENKNKTFEIYQGVDRIIYEPGLPL